MCVYFVCRTRCVSLSLFLKALILVPVVVFFISCVFVPFRALTAKQECVTDEETGTQTAVLTIRGLGAQRVTLSTFAIASKQTAAR